MFCCVTHLHWRIESIFARSSTKQFWTRKFMISWKKPARSLQLYYATLLKIGIFSRRFLEITNWQLLLTLCEKCPNTEFFLVRIFLYWNYRNWAFGHFSHSVNAFWGESIFYPSPEKNLAYILSFVRCFHLTHVYLW